MRHFYTNTYADLQSSLDIKWTDKYHKWRM